MERLTRAARSGEGIVLDAWRHSGRLYWGAVKEDNYPWIEVEVIAEDKVQCQASDGLRR